MSNGYIYRYSVISCNHRLMSIVSLYSCRDKTLVFIKIWSCLIAISNIYLYRKGLHMVIQNRNDTTSCKYSLEQITKWASVKLATSSIGICFTSRLIGIEIAYSHAAVLRLYNGIIAINPVFLFANVFASLVIGQCSFYYEYSMIA